MKNKRGNGTISVYFALYIFIYVKKQKPKQKLFVKRM